MHDRIQSAIPHLVPEAVDKLEALIIEVVTSIGEGRDCTEQLAAINAFSGNQHYDRETFFKLYSWTSERDFAELISMGPPPEIPDLTVDEIAACLDIVKIADEPRASFCRCILEQNFPDVAIIDVVYDSNDEQDNYTLAKKILDQAAKPDIIRL